MHILIFLERVYECIEKYGCKRGAIDTVRLFSINPVMGYVIVLNVYLISKIIPL